MDDIEGHIEEPQEAHICEKCGKIHAGNECGVDLYRLDGDQFILEFEKLPPDEHILKLRKTIQQLRDDRWQAMAKTEKYKRKLINVSRGLHRAYEEIKRQKFSIGKLKNTAEQNHQLLSTEYKSLARLVEKGVEYVCSLEKCDGSCVHVRQQYQKLQEDHDALITSEKGLKEHIMLLEVRVQEKSKEANTMTLHAKNRDISSDQKLSKIQKDFMQRETELKTLKKDFMVLQHKLEDEQTSKIAAIENVQEITVECERLNNVIAEMENGSKLEHQEKGKLQDKINDLQLQVKKVKSGVKDKVDGEMLKMMKDMDAYQGTLEKRLQEDVDKEKEKMRKELEEYIVEYRNNQTKMMKTMRTQGEKYKETIADLQQQLEKQSLESEQREKLLQAQIQQLSSKSKNMGSRVGSRKPSVTPSNNENLALLKQKDEMITSLHTEIDDLNDQIEDLEFQLEQVMKKNEKLGKLSELESLVQKQVEERKDLLESYSKVKEELQHYKQLEIERIPESKDNRYSNFGPLAIYQKRSIDKYGAFKASESSGYDFSDLKSTTSKSSYQRLMAIQNENYAKSAKSTKSQMFHDAGAKSSKSQRSVQDTSNHTGAKSSKSQRSIQDSFMHQLAARSSNSDRKPYEIAHQALQRAAHTNHSYQEIPRDKDRLGKTVTKYSSGSHLIDAKSVMDNGNRPLVPPISDRSDVEKPPKHPVKSQPSKDTAEYLYTDNLKAKEAFASYDSVSEVTIEQLGSEKQVAQNQTSKISFGPSEIDSIDSEMKNNFYQNGNVKSIVITQGENRTKQIETKGENSTRQIETKGENSTRQIETKGENSTRQIETKVSNKHKLPNPADKERQRLINDFKDIYTAPYKGNNKQKEGNNEAKGNHLTNKSDHIPDVGKQNRKVAFEGDNAAKQKTWKVSNKKWQPNFETASPSLSKANHPLHNPSTESLSSMSNLSTPYAQSPTIAPKGNVDTSRAALMKALGQKKGTANNSSWNIYKQLKVGRL